MTYNDGDYEQILTEVKHKSNLAKKKLYEYPGGNQVDGLPPVSSRLFAVLFIRWLLLSFFLFFFSLFLLVLHCCLARWACVSTLNSYFFQNLFRDVRVLDRASYLRMARRVRKWSFASCSRRAIPGQWCFRWNSGAEESNAWQHWKQFLRIFLQFVLV